MPSHFRIAAWNLNNRVGKVPFRSQAADAAIALGADLIVFTEYYPGTTDVHERFVRRLSDAGWGSSLCSGTTGDGANQVLMVSRLDLQRGRLSAPEFDGHLASNVLLATASPSGLTILGVRIPWYTGKTLPLRAAAWSWLANQAAILIQGPAVILGDLNVSTNSRTSTTAGHFSAMLSSGWTRAAPADGASFHGKADRRSEIDHILLSPACNATSPRYVATHLHHVLAGGPSALSDHAALVADVSVGEP